MSYKLYLHYCWLLFIQIIGIDDRDHADSNSYGHMMIELSDDEDYTSLFSGSGSGSGQITFGNKSSNVVTL